VSTALPFGRRACSCAGFHAVPFPSHAPRAAVDRSDSSLAVCTRDVRERPALEDQVSRTSEPEAARYPALDGLPVPRTATLCVAICWAMIPAGGDHFGCPARASAGGSPRHQSRPSRVAHSLRQHDIDVRCDARFGARRGGSELWRRAIRHCLDQLTTDEFPLDRNVQCQQPGDCLTDVRVIRRRCSISLLRHGRGHGGTIANDGICSGWTKGSRMCGV
jgi:hypothetical protein